MNRLLKRLALDRVNWNYVLAGLAVAVAGYAVWHLTEMGTRLAIGRAVRDLLAARNAPAARKTLLEAGNRALVLRKLKEALEGPEGSVLGKIEVAQTLLVPTADYGWNEPRPVYRALSSGVVNARRAAAYLLAGRAEFGDEAERVAVEWLRDRSATDRSLCFTILVQRKPKGIEGDLLAILRAPARTPEELDVLKWTLNLLSHYRPSGLADEVFALATDPARDVEVRRNAFRLLGQLPDAAVEKLRDAMIAVLVDRSASPLLRSVLAGELGKKEAYACEATWDALESVLVDAEARTDLDFTLQRACLRDGLAGTAPFDRLKRLLHDRRVYAHPYFGVRADVCTALASLGMRDKVSFDILLAGLVDDDPRDTQRVVRLEAWTSLWLLTKRFFGVDRPEIFQTPPGLPPEPPRDRIFALGRLMTGAPSEERGASVRKLVGDLDACRRARQTWEEQWPAIEAEWTK
jgi:hypothetical protein